MNTEKIKLAISPIAWSNDDLHELGAAISFKQCIAEMQQAGYQGCEVGHKFPRDTSVLTSMLNSHQLQVASAWFSTYFTEPERRQETIDGFIKHSNFLKAMQAKVIVVCECGYSIHGKATPLINRSPSFTKTDWQNLLNGLDEIGQIAKANAMTIVYHHHMGTGIETEAMIDRLMNETNENNVSLLLDTGHIYYAGGDPLRVLTKHSTRIKHIHLKDIRPEILNQVKTQQFSFLESVKAGVFTVPGDGCIDFAPIMQKLHEIHYEGWCVVEAEQDPAIANPLLYATKAMQYIQPMITQV